MTRFWRWNALLFFLVAVVLAIVYLHKIPPVGQEEDEPLDLSPGVAPARLINSNRDIGIFPASMIPPVHAVPAEAAAAVAATAPACTDSCRPLTWWQQQDPQHWVIQVLSASSRETALNYIEAQPDASLFAYYMESVAGVWRYVVTFGDFSNRDEAAAIAQVREFGNGSKAFPKSMQAIVGELQTAATASAPNPSENDAGGSAVHLPDEPVSEKPMANEPVATPAGTVTQVKPVITPSPTAIPDDGLMIPGTDNEVPAGKQLPVPAADPTTDVP